MTTTKYKWIDSLNHVQITNDTKHECDMKGIGKIVRNATSKGIEYQLFLNDYAYSIIHTYFNNVNWCQYKQSVIHFYGGNYIYTKGRDGFECMEELLNITINWI